MSHKAHKKYAIVRPAVFRRAHFPNAKREGLLQKDYDSMRLSIDGTLAIVSWNAKHRPAFPPSAVAALYDHAGIRAYLQANRRLWDPLAPEIRATGEVSETLRELPEGVTLEPEAFPWWVMVAALAAMTALVYFFSGV